ncbi:MAG: signal recognition particle-docking protein FtsY [Candidatus Portiera sp.]|nr:signal recognition particle-docking protein FtsY [Portiera sp.]
MIFDFLKLNRKKPKDIAKDVIPEDAIVKDDKITAIQDSPPTLDASKVDSSNQLQSINKINKSFVGRLRQVIGMEDKSLDSLAVTMEEELLMADFGVTMTNKVIAKWRDAASFIGKEGDDKGQKVMKILEQILEDTLTEVNHKLIIPEENRPFCLMVMGVNGSGKTTSVAKLSYYYKQKGLKLQLAAGDTYRAAAVEQLEHWANKLQISITTGDAKVESAAVIYKGMQEAINNQADIYIMDTSGRMPNNNPLKEQLRKCIQVIGKLSPDQKCEILLVLDASHGQSAIMQAKLFCEAVPVSGIALTKLDGVAKGGVIFALAEELKLPIRFIGVGEKETDLLEFDARSYVRELMSEY